jgi:hypothetical protein
VLVAPRLAFGLGPRRQGESLAEEVQHPVVARHDEPDVDESLHGLRRGPELEPGSDPHRCEVGRAEDQGGEHGAPVVVGEEPDQLAGGEGRGRHCH